MASSWFSFSLMRRRIVALHTFTATALCAALASSAALCLTGCSSKSEGAPSSSVQSAQSSIPSLPGTPSAFNLLIDQADAAFLKHNWEWSVINYMAALNVHLPNGPSSAQATGSYVRRKLSLANLYAGLEAKSEGNYYVAEQNFQSALANDHSNSAASQMLGEVTSEDAERQADRNLQSVGTGEYQIASADAPSFRDSAAPSGFGAISADSPDEDSSFGIKSPSDATTWHGAQANSAHEDELASSDNSDAVGQPSESELHTEHEDSQFNDDLWQKQIAQQDANDEQKEQLESKQRDQSIDKMQRESDIQDQIDTLIKQRDGLQDPITNVDAYGGVASEAFGSARDAYDNQKDSLDEQIDALQKQKTSL